MGIDRLEIAKSFANELRRRKGTNLVAVGVYGSVARGDDRAFSDIDMLVIVRKKRPRIRTSFRRGALVTVHRLTVDEARREIVGPDAWPNDALGGWRSTKPLYDPAGVIARLIALARKPLEEQFLESARRHLLETYEDYGKLRNAVAAGDLDEAREMALWFSGGAAGTLLDLEGHVLSTGRRLFIEARLHGKIGEAIWSLRYDARSLKHIERLSSRVWAGLLACARRKGIRIRGLMHSRPGAPPT